MTSRQPADHPPAGELRREIGALGVGALTINIIMGSGLFVIPAAMGALGAWAPAAIGLCAVVMLAVTLCLTEASSRVPRVGGIYGVVQVALGPAAGGVVGGMLWLSGTLAASGILAAAIDQVTPFVPWLGTAVGRPIAIIVTCLAFMWIPLRGARQSAVASEVTMAFKLAPLLLFCLLVAFLPAAPAAEARGLDLQVAAPLLILGMYLCAGVESGTVMNGEVRDPVRTLPAGLGGALVLYCALAVAIQLAAGHALGASLAGSRAPLVEGAARVGTWLPPVMATGAIVSMLGSAAGLASAMPRVMFALARDGLLPGALAGLHPQRKTPHVAIVTHGVLVAGLATAGQFTPLTIASSLASMALYVLGCIAALELRRRGVAEAGQVLAWRVTPVAAVVAILANLGIILSASRERIVALALASLLFAGLATLRASRRPGRGSA
ncbi:MAG: APC family permease [Gemmatimonadetes bacterium]|nr:APC family permease [Gemmatimonadota bacterium]